MNHSSPTDSHPPSDREQAFEREQTFDSDEMMDSEYPDSTRQPWSLSTKVTVWAIAATTIPLIILGSVAYWTTPPQPKPSGSGSAVQSMRSQYGLNLFLSTAGLAIASGAIATFAARRSIQPILKATHTSNTLINRMRRETSNSQEQFPEPDESKRLLQNLSVLEAQMPHLMAQQESDTAQVQLFMTITQRLRECLSQEEVLRVAVTEIRKLLRADRVAVFRFDSAENGTVVEESVAPSLPKMLWATLGDPCLSNYLEQYRQGRIRSIDNIYQAGLDDCHIGLLERFAVKANLIAPLIKENQLFGLMIVNQCSSPRYWQQVEIDLLSQLCTQVGLALDHVKLLEIVDSKASQSHIFIELARRIRTSLNEEDILKTTVEEVRKALATDRVIIYSFDAQWYGTVVAESAVPGIAKALWAKIKDPCFAEGYVEQYQAGRVQATHNIYEAGLTPCHLKQLEPFSVKANLVAPILKDDHLFALLIAHECSRPRPWQQAEIDLVAQLATQVGFALDHARILDHVEHAYQLAEASSEQQRQQKESLQHQVIDWMEQGGFMVQDLSSNLAQQMDSITTLYQQIKELSTETQQVQSLLTQSDTQAQLMQAIIQSTPALSQDLAQLQTRLGEANQLLQQLFQPTQKVELVSAQMSQIVSQLKLQAMNAALEATRMGNTAPEFASIGEKVLELARQLDANTTNLTAWIGTVRSQLSTLGLALQHEVQQTQAVFALATQTEQALAQMGMRQTEEGPDETQAIIQASDRQAQAIAAVNQLILEIATRANQSSEQAKGLASTLEQLASASSDAESDA